MHLQSRWRRIRRDVIPTQRHSDVCQAYFVVIELSYELSIWYKTNRLPVQNLVHQMRFLILLSCNISGLFRNPHENLPWNYLKAFHFCDAYVILNYAIFHLSSYLYMVVAGGKTMDAKFRMSRVYMNLSRVLGC